MTVITPLTSYPVRAQKKLKKEARLGLQKSQERLNFAAIIEKVFIEKMALRNVEVGKMARHHPGITDPCFV